jgi:hypothetical protein
MSPNPIDTPPRPYLSSSSLVKKKTSAAALLGLVAVVACLGLLLQMNSLRIVERENATLVQNLAAIRLAAARHESKQSGRTAGLHAASTADDDSVFQPVHGTVPDWNRIVLRVNQIDLHTDEGRKRFSAAIDQLLAGMSAEELANALETVNVPGLLFDQRMPLATTIAARLAKQDPQMFLQRFSSLVSTPNWVNVFRFSSAEAMKAWSEASPAAFQAWVEAQGAAGTFDRKSFDGKNPMQTDCENQVFRSLLASGDSATAIARMQALPPSQRNEILSHIYDLKRGSGSAAAAVVCAVLPERDQSTPLAQIAHDVVATSGLPGVAALMDQIAATPAQRDALAKSSAISSLAGTLNEITPKLADVYAWASSAGSPAAADFAIGLVLGNTTREGSFQQAADLVMRYYDQTGDPGVLVAFFRSQYGLDAAKRNAEAAQPMFDKITDPRMRMDFGLPPKPAAP